jgi:hypothetical protein
MREHPPDRARQRQRLGFAHRRGEGEAARDRAIDRKQPLLGFGVAAAEIRVGSV